MARGALENVITDNSAKYIVWKPQHHGRFINIIHIKFLTKFYVTPFSRLIAIGVAAARGLRVGAAGEVVGHHGSSDERRQ